MRNIPAWREGYKAYSEGTNINDNPYLNYEWQGTVAFYWHEGWLAAQEDSADD